MKTTCTHKIIYTFNKETPLFSFTLGGVAHFSLANCTSKRPKIGAFSPKNQRECHLEWTLRDHISGNVLVVWQVLKTSSAQNSIKLISNQPLLHDRIYETLSISRSTPPKANSTPDVKPLDAPVDPEFHRLGVARGTNIMTINGEKPVEQLKAGDRLVTRNHGIQKIRWIGRQLRESLPRNTPIIFRKEAISNERDLIMSPDQRILLRGIDAITHYGTNDVLIPARHMVNDTTIFSALSAKMQYYQIVMDQHVLIYAEAITTESFLPDLNGIQQLDTSNRQSLIETLKDIEKTPETYSPIRKNQSTVGFQDKEKAINTFSGPTSQVGVETAKGQLS